MHTLNANFQSGRTRLLLHLDSATAQQSSVDSPWVRVQLSVKCPTLKRRPASPLVHSLCFLPFPPPSLAHTSLPLTNCLCPLPLFPSRSVCHFRTLLAAAAHPCSTKRETGIYIERERETESVGERVRQPEANSLERH